METSDNPYESQSFLARPPRHVPILVRCRMLFGGFVNQFGWIFFGFGMIFVWIFGLNCDPMALVDFRGPLASEKGVITNAIETSMSEGGGEHSKGTPIYLFKYKFEFEGTSYKGQSYKVGRGPGAGTKVTIEFPEGRPERSRIKGMRTAAFPIVVLFVFIFPIVGLCFMICGFLFGWKTAKLLRIGEFGYGKLIDKKATGTEINSQRVYKFTFEFQTEAGETKQAIAKTHQTQKLEDNEWEPLLYDPVYPEKATLLDHLPGEPQVSYDGQIATNSSTQTLLCLIIPAITVVGHSLAFYYLFLK